MVVFCIVRQLDPVTRPRQIGLTGEEVASGTPMLDTRGRIEARAEMAAKGDSKYEFKGQLDGVKKVTIDYAKGELKVKLRNGPVT